MPSQRFRLAIIAFITTVVFAGVGSTFATSPGSDSSKLQPNTPIINSMDELTEYVYSDSVANNPIANLSHEAQARFLAGITFSDDGVSGLYITDLVRELPASQLYELLSLFGLENAVAQIHGVRVETALDKAIVEGQVGLLSDGSRDWFKEGYKCDGPGSCVADSAYLCTINC
ncbi:hypothetical protein VCB98_12565 [Gammaproteobacteria bacterium AB-CW1]|uniref:Uncharacterized protein n=1 Tax=Natronospira elongata TaxID=3110268 RepID=A0AAP6MMX3_9GAMM|nr:hypothetical protein [Gammaproteobacteria bacterium AB-CW1]